MQRLYLIKVQPFIFLQFFNCIFKKIKLLNVI